MLVQAAGEKLVPRVDGGLLRLVHEVELLPQAQPAFPCAGLVGLAAGQDPPLDLGLDPLVFEGPDVASQPGGLPLGGVLKGGLVVSVAQLPGGAVTPTYFITGFPTAVTSAW